MTREISAGDELLLLPKEPLNFPDVVSGDDYDKTATGRQSLDSFKGK